MALLVGGGLLVMFIIPSSVFCSLENWHIIDSVYYCFCYSVYHWIRRLCGRFAFNFANDIPVQIFGNYIQL